MQKILAGVRSDGVYKDSQPFTMVQPFTSASSSEPSAGFVVRSTNLSFQLCLCPMVSEPSMANVNCSVLFWLSKSSQEHFERRFLMWILWDIVAEGVEENSLVIRIAYSCARLSGYEAARFKRIRKNGTQKEIPQDRRIVKNCGVSTMIINPWFGHSVGEK